MANPEYLSIKFDESGLPWRNLIGWEYEECEERAPGYELEQTGDGGQKPAWLRPRGRVQLDTTQRLNKNKRKVQ